MRGITVRGLLVLTIASLMIIMFASTAAGENADISNGIFPGTELKKVEPFRVNNDAELASYADSGTGTAGDPYILENLEINATGYGAAIYIGNTTAHFKVQNCSLSYAQSVSWPHHAGAGIILYNLANAVVMNNNFTGNAYSGIYAFAAGGTIMTGNLCENGMGSGISLYLTDDCQLTGNDLQGNGYAGMTLTNSNHNTIGQNTFSSNTNYDIYLSAYTGLTSSYNFIDRNRCDGTTISICLDHADWNIVQGNRGTGNDRGVYLSNTENNSIEVNEFSGLVHGVSLFNSVNNTVLDNQCTGYQSGVYLSSSQYNNISRNDLSDCLQGINVQDSSWNELLENSCSESVHGIYLLRSNNNNLTDNECWNDQNGIYLHLSDGCVVRGNQLYDCTQGGLIIDQSNGATVSGNNILDNAMFGCYLIGGSTGNQLLNNTLVNNTVGVQLDECNGNQVNYNDISGTLVESGIVLLSSSNNSVQYNTCTGSLENGILLDGSDGNTLANNNCSEGLRGIFLTGSSGNTIHYNTCRGDLFGIYLDTSDSNEVRWNNCSDNDNTGIHLELSNYNVISENIVHDNNDDDIVLRYSDNNTITNNNCSSLSYGLNLYYSNNNTISNNDLLNWDCIYIFNSNDNVLFENNLVSNSGGHGIMMQYSRNNTIANNDCTDNDRGISVEDSSYNIISNNTCSVNNVGIYLGHSSYNIISNNTCSGNTNYGIYLDSSGYNTILNNDLSLNGYEGVYLGASSSYNIIANNNCSGMSVGIDIDGSCDHNTIHNNTCFDNTNYGIYMDSSSNNTVSNNNCSGKDVSNTKGIYLHLSNHNIISNNNCSGNDNTGIILELSNYNLISENIVHDNNNDDIVLRFSDHNTIMNNNCSSFGYGLNLYYSNNNTIGNNDLLNWDCIYIYSSNDNVLFENSIVSNSGGHGIMVQYSSNNTIDNNDCTGNDRGISVEYSSYNIISNNNCSDNTNGIFLVTSVHNIISNNTCDQNVNNGIVLWFGSNNNTMSNNTCSGNSYGIHLESSDGNALSWNRCGGNFDNGLLIITSINNTISDNTISDNTNYGIYLVSSSGNRFSYNVLIGNNGASFEYSISHVQAYDDGMNYWNATTRGNYWLDWTAPDNDTDGIVDSPYVIDGGGNIDHYPLTISLNITSPSTTVYTNQVSIIISGTAIGPDIISIAWYNAADGSSGNCSGTFSWSATVSLVAGTNEITVTLTDGIGGTVDDNVTIICDLTKPTVSITFPPEGYLNNTGSILVTWTGGDNETGIDHYAVSSNGVSWADIAGTSYTFVLADGNYTIQVRAYDVAGNYNGTSVAITVDTTAPSLEILSPSDDSFDNDGSVTVTWAASDVTSGIVMVEVSSDGANWTNVTGNTSYVWDLTDGIWTLYVRATDAIGNLNATSVNITVDTIAPSLTVVSPNEGAYSLTNIVSIDWEANDTGSGIALMEISFDGANWTAVLGSNHTSPQLDEGPVTVHIRVTDHAGNSASAMVNFTVDTVSPTVETSPTGTGLELNEVITVEFSEVMNVTSVSIVVIGVTGTLEWNENVAVFTPSALEYNRDYLVMVSGQDLAGNLMAVNWTFSTRSVGDIIGVIVDEDGEPIANATVTIDDVGVASTDANGRYTFLNVSVGTYAVMVEKDGYDPLSFNVTVVQGDTTDLGTTDLVPEGPGDEGDGDDSFWLYAIIAMLVLAVAGVGAFIFFRKK